jgi:hypothetical protein
MKPSVTPQYDAPFFQVSDYPCTDGASSALYKLPKWTGEAGGEAKVGIKTRRWGAIILFL